MTVQCRHCRTQLPDADAAAAGWRIIQADGTYRDLIYCAACLPVIAKHRMTARIGKLYRHLIVSLRPVAEAMS